MSYPSTFVSIQNGVLAKLRLADNTTNRSLVKDWINQTYAQTAMETQAFQKAGYGSLTPGQPTYDLPEEIIELKWVIAHPSGETFFGTVLDRLTLEEVLDRRRSNGGTNDPSSPVSGYALIGLNQLEFWPTPSSTDVVQFYYSYLPTALSADADVPILGEPWNSNVLSYGALAHAGEMQSDPLGPYWDAKYQDWKTRFRTHVNRRGGTVDRFPAPIGSAVPHDRSADVVW